MERRTALRVRQKDAIALALKRPQDALDAGHDRREGRLHQEPWAIAQTEAWKLGRLDLDHARDRDLGAGKYLERHLLRRQARVQLVHQSHDRGRVVAVAGADVRCRHERFHACGGRGTRERDGALDRRRAVIDAWKHVAMQIDHRCTEQYAPAKRVRPQRIWIGPYPSASPSATLSRSSVTDDQARLPRPYTHRRPCACGRAHLRPGADALARRGDSRSWLSARSRGAARIRGSPPAELLHDMIATRRS